MVSLKESNAKFVKLSSGGVDVCIGKKCAHSTAGAADKINLFDMEDNNGREQLLLFHQHPSWEYFGAEVYDKKTMKRVETKYYNHDSNLDEDYDSYFGSNEVPSEKLGTKQKALRVANVIEHEREIRVP